ncbi:hypothetical protein VTL71DRAFT_15102 [Oculimacula yallundae]|uniref:Uncharacterized protein n=1 Tax=Oculimacula yallundae TaxID=86028 RepID=A0ABR4CHW9_9HELO
MLPLLEASHSSFFGMASGLRSTTAGEDPPIIASPPLPFHPRRQERTIALPGTTVPVLLPYSPAAFCPPAERLSPLRSLEVLAPRTLSTRSYLPQRYHQYSTTFCLRKLLVDAAIHSIVRCLWIVNSRLFTCIDQSIDRRPKVALSVVYRESRSIRTRITILRSLTTSS